MEKYYVVKMLTNTEGQDAPSIDVYATKDNALVAYHNTLAAYINAEDVLYAVVQVVNGYGNVEMMESVNHIPTPEPEPQPDLVEI